MTAFDPEFTVHFHRLWLSTLRRIMQERRRISFRYCIRLSKATEQMASQDIYK